MKKPKSVFVVVSGKGGVGKSSVSSLLSLYLSSKGNKVGLVDADLCNPSIPKMFKVDSKSVIQSEYGWVPVQIKTDFSGSLSLISIDFLIKNKEESIVLRGPKKRLLLSKFINNVDWKELDYLVIDTPPGTSDEQLWIAEALNQFKPFSIVVTTSQNISVQDNKKEILFCREIGLSIVGVIENMSGFVCSHCKQETNIFSKRGGEYLSEEYSLPFLGRLPLCPSFVQLCQESSETNLIEHIKNEKLFHLFSKIGDLILKLSE